jgi:hypothetical protein
MKVLLSTANLGAIDEAAMPHVGQMAPDGIVIEMAAYDDLSFPPRRNALHPRLQAKLPKMLAHELRPGYDFYMWLDASIYLAHPHAVIWMIAQLGDSDLALFRHPFRASIATEADYCMRLMAEGNVYLRDRYANEPIAEQARSYLADPDFVDDRLFACGVFCYRVGLVSGSPAFLPDWYYHCARHSVQDQLSLPYLLHKHRIRYAQIDDNLFETPYFGMKQHRR